MPRTGDAGNLSKYCEFDRFEAWVRENEDLPWRADPKVIKNDEAIHNRNKIAENMRDWLADETILGPQLYGQLLALCEKFSLPSRIGRLEEWCIRIRQLWPNSAYYSR